MSVTGENVPNSVAVSKQPLKYLVLYDGSEHSHRTIDYVKKRASPFVAARRCEFRESLVGFLIWASGVRAARCADALPHTTIFLYAAFPEGPVGGDCARRPARRRKNAALTRETRAPHRTVACTTNAPPAAHSAGRRELGFD